MFVSIFFRETPQQTLQVSAEFSVSLREPFFPELLNCAQLLVICVCVFCGLFIIFLPPNQFLQIFFCFSVCFFFAFFQHNFPTFYTTHARER